MFRPLGENLADPGFRVNGRRRWWVGFAAEDIEVFEDVARAALAFGVRLVADWAVADASFLSAFWASVRLGDPVKLYSAQGFLTSRLIFSLDSQKFEATPAETAGVVERCEAECATHLLSSSVNQGKKCCKRIAKILIFVNLPPFG